MSEPILDVYCDQFQVNIGPYGAVLNFMVSSADPPAPGSIPQSHKVTTVRMSLEHLKTVAFMLHTQVMAYERHAGISVPLPREVLNALRIGPEDWETFWRQGT